MEYVNKEIIVLLLLLLLLLLLCSRFTVRVRVCCTGLEIY